MLCTWLIHWQQVVRKATESHVTSLDMAEIIYINSIYTSELHEICKQNDSVYLLHCNSV